MISEDKFNRTNSKVYVFSEFSFETENLLLQRNSEVIPLAPKALEVLRALVEAKGKLVTKQEILERVWANTFVEEANLTHHISALRKALGEDKNGRKFIETIPRRGYCFIAPVNELSQSAAEITISEKVSARFVEEIEMIDAFAPRQLNAERSGRYKLLITSVAVASILIFGGVLFYFYVAGQVAVDLPRRVEVRYVRVSDDKSVGGTTVSPDGKFVAYIQNYSDAVGGSLFVRQLETNREIRLLEPDARTFGSIDFSPDSSLIYYISFEKNAKIGVLYSIPILGGQPKRLIDLDASTSFFAVSPDGKKAVFYRSSPESKVVSLVSSPLDGTSGNEKIVLSHADSESFFGETMAFSPDGSSITFGQVQNSESRLKLAQVDVQTGAVSLLAEENFRNIGKMCFRADGRELFFVGEKERYTQKIYALDLTTRQIRLVTNDGDYYGNYGLGITADGKSLAADLMDSKADIWSAAADGDLTAAANIKRGTVNGKRGIVGLANGAIAYTARVGEKRDIWKINADSSDAQPLTNDAFTEKDLAASRDGNLIAFVSDRAAKDGSDNWHLFVMNSDGSGVRQLTSGDTNDMHPDFSPDGGWIVYASMTAEKSVVKKISVQGGTPVELTDYFGINPVYSPDGSRLALKLLSPTRSQPSEIVIFSADGGKPEKKFPVLDFEHLNVVFPIRWTPDGSGIIFRREANGTCNLWRQDVNSSAELSQITDFTSDVIYNFTFSADGKRLLISRGFYQTNAVIIQNFQTPK